MSNNNLENQNQNQKFNQQYTHSGSGNNFGQNSPTKNYHQNMNQFSPQNQADNHFSYQNFVQSKHRNQEEGGHQYLDEDEQLKHFQSDFRYYIINIFYQWIKNSLYLIIFAVTAQYAFNNYETEGCYYIGPSLQNQTQNLQYEIQQQYIPEQSSFYQHQFVNNNIQKNNLDNLYVSEKNNLFQQFNDNEYQQQSYSNFRDIQNLATSTKTASTASTSAQKQTTSSKQESSSQPTTSSNQNKTNTSNTSTQNDQNRQNYTMQNHQNGQALIAMVFNSSIGLIFLNLISLVYMYVQDKFVKLEFYIIYGLNLIMTVLIIMYSFYDSSKNVYVCQSAQIFYHAFMYISIKKEIEVAYILYKQISDTTIRQINICSNCVFAYILAISPNQSHCSGNAQTIVFAIQVTNVMALIFFTILNFGYKSCSVSDDTRRALKFITLLMLSAFFMVYAMVLYNFNSDTINMHDDTCMPFRFVLRNYQFIIPISMLGMIFVFHSLNKDYDEEFKLDFDNQVRLKSEASDQQQNQNQQTQQDQVQNQQFNNGQNNNNISNFPANNTNNFNATNIPNNQLSPNNNNNYNNTQNNNFNNYNNNNNNLFNSTYANNSMVKNNNNNNLNMNTLSASPFKYQDDLVPNIEDIRQSRFGGTGGGGYNYNNGQMNNFSPQNNNNNFYNNNNNNYQPYSNY